MEEVGRRGGDSKSSGIIPCSGIEVLSTWRAEKLYYLPNYEREGESSGLSGLARWMESAKILRSR